MSDDEEAIKHAERDCRNRQEIHRGNRFAVITQERDPSLG